MLRTFPIPTLPASAAARPVVGGPAVLAASEQIATQATDSLYVDTFRPTRDQNLAAFAGAKARGVDVHLLLDTETLDAPRTPAGSRDALRAVGQISEYGDDPFKQHGKAISRDGVEAMVASDVSDVKSEPRMEFGVRFQGPAAAALQGVQQLTSDTPARSAAQALDAARALGVVVNDPHHQRRDVSETLTRLIDDATGDLFIATKEFDSKALTRQLADAAGRGVQTSLVTQSVGHKQAEKLRKAGVSLTEMDGDEALANHTALHGTIVATPQATLMTSMPLISRAIEGSSGRQSRELGVVVDGATATQLTTEVRQRLGR